MATKKEQYFSVYAEHNKVLRVWLVAYGVGAPVLFLNNKLIWQTIASSQYRGEVISLFALGVLMQVLLAFVNKFTQWCLYYGTENSKFKRTRWYTVSEKVSEWIWLDFVLDLFTIGLFVAATGFVLSAFA